MMSSEVWRAWMDVHRACDNLKSQSKVKNCCLRSFEDVLRQIAFRGIRDHRDDLLPRSQVLRHFASRVYGGSATRAGENSFFPGQSPDHLKRRLILRCDYPVAQFHVGGL